MFTKQKRKALPEHIIREKSPNSTIYYSRLIATVFFRLRLDAMKTKFSKNAKCICGEKFTLHHFLFYCQQLHSFLPKCFIDKHFTEDKFREIISDQVLMVDISEALVHSPVHALL
eukprot:TRINITY_DN9277_c0_g1_i2.p1 TRINITY_DN9277_c0_g1~~TRINITY_DN9277_c0_g1_i2.p1  ORF type:complete len:115 (+),score=7.42 TRINITY_DN9277_c0_g1_i2:77-421(+)